MSKWSAFFLLVPVVGVILFAAAEYLGWSLPSVQSTIGARIDHLYYVLLAITGVTFIFTQLGLAFLIYFYAPSAGEPSQPRSSGLASVVLWLVVPLAGFAGLLYAFPMPASSRMWMAAALGVGWPMVLALLLVGRKDRQAGRATFMHGNNLLESVWTIVPAIIFLFIAAYQYPVWAELRYPKQRPDNIMPIRVVARQFEWRFVYPGPDGKLDTPDDILFPNELHVVKGREVWVDLRSMDVLHSFFLPLHRVKQDVVPGLNIPVWFDTRQSTWEYQAEACDFTAGDILDPAGLSAGGSPALDLIKGRIGSSTDAERVSTDLNKLLDDVSLADPAIFDAKALSEDVRALWNSHPQGAKRRLLNRKLIDESLKSRVRPLGRQFDIICAELCGWGHYKMKGVMIVHETQEELDHWLAERYREQSEASR